MKTSRANKNEKPQVINITPHNVNIFTPDGKEFIYPPSGIFARRRKIQKQSQIFKGNIPLFEVSFGDIYFEDFQKNEYDFTNNPNNIYIVSAICLNGDDVPENFFAPGDAVIGPYGKAIGSMGLCRKPTAKVEA